MPQFTIDGKSYEYEGRPMLLQYCLDHGIEIPYFCYHPGMSVPTNCRMCLVEVGWPRKDRATGEIQKDDDGNPIVMWGRKPNTACNTPVDPDMIVKTHKASPKVKEMQQGVLEYMLVNHPLDCPICDQAGECPLQIWTYKYGPEGSRFESRKSHKPKRVELGPNVVLDAERCINCTRCTRFTEEISKTGQLSIVGRGDKNYPSTAPGQSFTDPYSMNTIDLCPVGALTSKDFRFKARVWEMAYTPSIDMCDSTGTNIDVWTRDNEVLRITPRYNKEINEWWMPDAHRLSIDKYNKDRVSGIRLKGAIPSDFEAGINQAAGLLNHFDGKKVFVGSAYASLESNYALKRLAAKHGVEDIYYIPHVEQGFGDDWLIQDDRTPNSAACELLGFKAIESEALAQILHADVEQMVYMLENDRFFELVGADALAGNPAIVHATQHKTGMENADVLLPAATSIEGEGTYINKEGTPQVTRLAKQIKQMSPDMWMRIPKSRLDKAAVAVDNWRNLENVFDVLPSWLLIAKVAEQQGEAWGWKQHKDIFPILKEEFEVLNEVHVSYKVPKEAFKITQYDFAIR